MDTVSSDELLEEAFRDRDLDTLRYALASGVNVNKYSKHINYKTFLFYAVDENLIEFIQPLVEAGANTSQLSIHSKNLFYMPIASGRITTVKHLIKLNIPLNIRNCPDNTTALHQASNLGLLEIVRELINAGADMNAVDRSGKTALHYAAIRHRIDVYELLLLNGANQFIKDDLSHQAIDYLHFGADDESDIDNHLAFYAYSRLNEIQKTTLYIPFCIWWRAFEKDRVDVIIKWIRLDAIFQMNESLIHPLHQAAFDGHFEIVEELVAANANINPLDGENNTPLHLALLKGHTPIAKFLIHAGADITIRESINNLTVLDIAMAQQDQEIIELIQQTISLSSKPWIHHAQKLINDISIMITDGKSDFEAVYRYAASRRHQIKIDMDPLDECASKFGSFFVNNEDRIMEYFYPNTQTNQIWYKQSPVILDWMKRLIDDYNVQGDKANTNALFTLTPFSVDSAGDRHSAKNNLIREIGRKNLGYKQSADITIQGYDYICFYRMNMESFIPILTFKFYVVNDYPDQSLAKMFYYKTGNPHTRKQYFAFANEIFCDLLNVETSLGEFLSSVARLMHFLAMTPAVKRGNASIVECIVLACAHYRGIDIQNLNQPPEGCVLRWDFQAFITPNPDDYIAWFIQHFYHQIRIFDRASCIEYVEQIQDISALNNPINRPFG